MDHSVFYRLIMKLALLTVSMLLLVVAEGTADRILSRRTKRDLASPLHVGGIRDPFGSYCQRRGGCCPGRDDQCTVPYLDTICYCDLFCNRTVSDCCPDFWNHCLGVQPPFIGKCGWACSKAWLQVLLKYCCHITVFQFLLKKTSWCIYTYSSPSVAELSWAELGTVGFL